MLSMGAIPRGALIAHAIAYAVTITGAVLVIGDRQRLGAVLLVAGLLLNVAAYVVWTRHRRSGPPDRR
jgi:hypothetical protein